MQRKKFCVESNFLRIFILFKYSLIVQINEQSDIDIDNNYKIFTNKITKCFLVEDSGIEPLTS